MPLHRQIETQIRNLIQDGTLRVGSRLPPTRKLVEQLGVNRGTICTAYDALAASGDVAPRVGRGTEVVRSAGPQDVSPDGGPSSRLDWSRLLSEALTGNAVHSQPLLIPESRNETPLDFAALLPDESLFPVQELRSCLDAVLHQEGETLLQYGPPTGHPALREILAERMRSVGVPVTAQDVLIVNGAQQGLDLFCKALLDPGDAVAVESPTYGNLLPVLRLHRAEVVPVKMTPHGLDLDLLENVLRTRRIKFLYTMPHFQNPTGITSGLGHRKKLLDIAARYGLLILEDGYEEDLRWEEGEMQPLSSLDRSGRVCYVGTFSKGLCPGFRIGWMTAHRDLLSQLAYLKRCADYHSPPLLQAALAEFCKRGEYDRHLRVLRTTYRSRMAAAATAFATHMPESVRWRVPEGGYCLWVELPTGVSVEELGARLQREGMRVTPGRHFFATDPGYGCFRMSISRAREPEIHKGIEILGRHLRELVPQATRGENATALPYV